MKLRKVLAGLTASVLAVSAMAMSAGAYDAFLMYTDSAWGWGSWNAEDCAAGNVDITGDGTYTVFVDSTLAAAWGEDEETGEPFVNTANGVTVFCIDIAGLGTDLGLAEEVYNADTGITISDLSVTTYNNDGTSKKIDVDNSKLVWGDIESNGKLRIEIYNEFGNTKADPGFNTADVSFNEKIAVTFTLTGLPAGSATTETEEETTATAGNTDAAVKADKASADTGIEGVAVAAGLAVVAAGAIIISKKRK